MLALRLRIRAATASFAPKLCGAVFSRQPVGEQRRSTSTNSRLFNRILIANRGEIACRVIRTAKRLGIETVAIYSEPDAEAKHVKMADMAVCVGPAISAQSYLNIDNVVAAVKSTKAEAVHPGYGFLSENRAFAKRLEDIGVVFIGPDSHAIEAMGDKIESKKLAKRAGVNVIPGYLGEVRDEEHLLQIAHEIGYPVMIKAAHGGGGKGMRIAWNDEEARLGFRLSKQEAKSSFGNDSMLVEKFIDNPRHIEIQVLGDTKGNVLYFPERECSIQRRNQKVIEEAPSPLLDPQTRRAMGEQAVLLAKAVGYRSAGTVEMLCDPQKNFYFLEMNTRLQVEHPITEYITGVDLVEQMIRVAAGEPLSIRQEDIRINGWAVESRVYAEDPYRNFLPSIGRLVRYTEPTWQAIQPIGNEPHSFHPNPHAEKPPAAPEPGINPVRVDSGVVEGSEISIYYDPLIAKLITYGPDRATALARQAAALDAYVIRGVNHNVPFLRTVMENKRFVAGNLSTKFIPEEFPRGFEGHVLTPLQRNELTAAAAMIYMQRAQRNLTISGKVSYIYTGPERIEFAIRFADVHAATPYAALATRRVVVEREGELTVIDEPSGEQAQLQLEYDWPLEASIFRGRLNNRHEFVTQFVEDFAAGYILQHCGTKYRVWVETPLEAELRKYMPAMADAGLEGALKSPMPGAVVSISVKPGDKVVMGQELAVVEAMKMQNVLRSEVDGVVKKVLVKPGQSVAVDEVLIEFDVDQKTQNNK